MTPAAILRELVKIAGKMVIAPGVYDGLTARLAAEAGFEVLYMTGAGTSASRLGQPDLGLITLPEMVANAGMIAECSGLPVISDADTGYGNPLNVIRTVREFERAGVAGIHLEDQVFPKQCGHLDGKRLVSAEEFVGKIKAAVDARRDPDFIIIARTDARTVNGFEDAMERACLYAEAGADFVFVESPLSRKEMASIPARVAVPCLINVAGPASKTPALLPGELAELGFKIAIYPAVAMDAVVNAVRRSLKSLREEGVAWDLQNLLGPRKLFEALGLETWQAHEKNYKARKEDSHT